MPNPSDNHLVAVTVYELFGSVLEGATVTITHSNGTISGTTNDQGEFVGNLATLSSWSVGDALSIYATKTGEGTKTETTTVSSGAGQTETITLAEEEVVEGQFAVENVAKINKAMLISYDKRDITRTNRLPVSVFNTLIPDNYDYIALTYVASGNGTGEIDTVTYKSGGASGTTVGVLTLAYDSTNRITTVTKT